MAIAKKKKAFQSKIAAIQFPLLDSQEPNLYRHVFPYEEVCRIEFDNRFVFIDPPEEIFITDTTF
ncbi:MAG: 2-isopropylmalate synthase, partial [Thermodesulfobacteriota bacterium]|nr:2-isopropylmalate synthase [Thermodesulfobacteriota bacterium]